MTEKGKKISDVVKDVYESAGNPLDPKDKTLSSKFWHCNCEGA